MISAYNNLHGHLKRLVAVLALYVPALVALGSFLSVYIMASDGPSFTDELHWSLQNAHVPYDGFRMVNLYAQCESNASWTVPFPLMPGRLFAWLFLPDSLLSMRYLGMLKYASCVTLLAGLAYVLWERSLPFILLLATSAMLLSLGFLPSLMLFDRPESAIVIAVLVLTAITLAVRHIRSRIARAVLCLLFCLVASYLYGVHAKALFFFPFICALILRLRVPMLWSRPVLINLNIAFGVCCMMLWAEQQRCPDNWLVRRILDWHTLMVETLKNDPGGFLREALINLSNARMFYTRPFWQSDQYMGILNVPSFSRGCGTFCLATDLMTGALLFALVALFCAAAVHALSRFFSNRGKRPLEPRPFFSTFSGLLLALPIVAVMATKRNGWSFWEVNILWPTLLLLLVICISSCRWYRNKPVMLTFIGFILLTGMMSHAGLERQWGVFYAQVSSPAVNGEIGMHIFQGINDAPERDKRILALAAQCHIPLDQTAHHVVFSDETFFPLRKTFEPYYGNMLFAYSLDGKVPYLDFLRRKQSSGVLTTCSRLPHDLRALAREDNGLCCISKESLNAPQKHAPHKHKHKK